jgi:hypothetical protein
LFQTRQNAVLKKHHRDDIILPPTESAFESGELNVDFPFSLCAIHNMLWVARRKAVVCKKFAVSCAGAGRDFFSLHKSLRRLAAYSFPI